LTPNVKACLHEHIDRYLAMSRVAARLAIGDIWIVVAFFEQGMLVRA